MKVAIPLFTNRVSPHFDFAEKALIAKVENGEVIAREQFSLINLNTIRRGALLREHGVDVVICGGISTFSVRLLLENGMQVIPMVAGEVEDVLNQFVKGHLSTGSISFSQKAKSGRYRLRKGKCRGGGTDLTYKRR